MIPRHAETRLREALADTPAVLIHGPRQCGKSTLAQKVARDLGATLVTLDDLNTLEFATRNPEGFLGAHRSPLAIDEVQRAPGLLLALKAEIDRDRRPGRFLLTGSANVLTLPKVADSLAGRLEIVDLRPFTQAEIEARPADFRPVGRDADSADWIERALRGGFPEPFSRATPRRRQAWFDSYLRTLLERDVRDLAQIQGLIQLPRLLKTLALRVGETLNISALSRETGLPPSTLERYVDLFRALFLVQTLPPWTQVAAQAAIKAPKIFLVDSGLLAAVAGWDVSLLAKDVHLQRTLLKQLVYQQVRAIPEDRVFHLRTVRQREVDFVIESSDGLMRGLHVTTATNAVPDDFDGLRYLAELAGNRFELGVVITAGTRFERVDERLEAWPVGALWTSADR